MNPLTRRDILAMTAAFATLAFAPSAFAGSANTDLAVADTPVLRVLVDGLSTPGERDTIDKAMAFAGKVRRVVLVDDGERTDAYVSFQSASVFLQVDPAGTVVAARWDGRRLGDSARLAAPEDLRPTSLASLRRATRLTAPDVDEVFAMADLMDGDAPYALDGSQFKACAEEAMNDDEPLCPEAKRTILACCHETVAETKKAAARVRELAAAYGALVGASIALTDGGFDQARKVEAPGLGIPRGAAFEGGPDPMGSCSTQSYGLLGEAGGCR